MNTVSRAYISATEQTDAPDRAELSADTGTKRKSQKFARIRSIHPQRTQNRKLLKKSYLWHRKVGLLISLPLILVALSGIVLNHAHRLGIDDVYIRNKTILSLYGMTPKSPLRSMQVEDRRVSSLDGMLFLDSRLAADAAGALRGLASLDDGLLVATESQLFLFAHEDGALIEKLGEESLPEGTVLRLALVDSRVRLDTSSGMFSSSPDLAEFQAETRNALPEPEFASLPPAIEEDILRAWRGRGVSLWRLILDLHSGALFGFTGTFLSDLLAVCMLLLVASGFYNSRKIRR